MQIKIFTIPLIGGDAINDDMNSFLRSHKIINVEKHFFSTADSGYWCFCVNYLENSDTNAQQMQKQKVDYKKVLDDKAFAVFTRLREIRKQVADESGIPAFAVFTDSELAQIAQLNEITPENMLTIKGIGQSKVEKYASYFCQDMPVASVTTAEL